jgi:hypothetical protein
VRACGQKRRTAANAQRTEHVLADTKLTPLFVRIGIPLIGTTSLPSLLVTFPVFLLKPVNCTVAPSTESMMDPTTPIKRPAHNNALNLCSHSRLQSQPFVLFCTNISRSVHSREMILPFVFCAKGPTQGYQHPLMQCSCEHDIAPANAR